MSRYFLSQDCFASRIGPHWIVLSISQDRYYCVEHERLSLIGDRIEGWEGGEFGSEMHGSTAEAVLRSLISTGVITGEARLGKAFADSQVPRHDGILAPQQDPVTVPTGSFLRFFAACAWADWSLRRRTIAAILGTLKGRRPRSRGSAQEEDRELAAALVAVFDRLRPLYPRAYRCLFDSLALLGFMARHGLSPRIVFGVTADPFQAHCWLQLGPVLLNEDDDQVRRFVPIMSV